MVRTMNDLLATLARFPITLESQQSLRAELQGHNDALREHIDEPDHDAHMLARAARRIDDARRAQLQERAQLRADAVGLETRLARLEDKVRSLEGRL